MADNDKSKRISTYLQFVKRLVCIGILELFEIKKLEYTPRHLAGSLVPHTSAHAGRILFKAHHLNTPVLQNKHSVIV